MAKSKTDDIYIEGLWVLHLRSDQIDTLQAVLNHVLGETNKYNKDWFPAKLTIRVLTELIEVMNDVTG